MPFPLQNDLEEHLPAPYFIGEDRFEIPPSVFRQFRKVLRECTDERPIQEFLEANPRMLVYHLSGHLGRWVVPLKRLGSQHVVDFMIADLSSAGLRWIAVELESPRSRLFTNRGDPTAALTHAIRQVQDWRAWLGQNLSYARRKNSRGGLGLADVRSRLPAMVLIGRRSHLSNGNEELRNQMCDDLNLWIHTYDWLTP